MSRTTFERFYRNPKAISMAIGATAFAVLGGLSSVSLSESFHESGGGLAPVASAPAAVTSSTAPTKTVMFAKPTVIAVPCAKRQPMPCGD